MKAKDILTGLAIATLGTLPFCAKAQQINPITKAMLDGYTEVLRENPSDYFTLYQRGAQYYQLSMYDQALNDLMKALSVTPHEEKDMLNREYSLLADINIEIKDYEKALDNVNKALNLQPDNYADLYKKGNICLYLNRGQDAYDAFRSMQRLKTRSQEASFGMAKAAIMLGNFDEARRLMQQAQDADPSNYLTFCRVGDLKRDLGDDESAAADYLSAFSLSTDSSRPLESLIALANANYPAFNSAITYALSRSDNQLPLYFLKGNISLTSGHYAEAKEALGQLLKSKEGQEGEVYAAMARACYALNQLDEAQTNADISIISSPSQANYVTKSKIELAKGNPAAALLSARKATAFANSDNESLKACALAAAANGDTKEALANLNEAVMNNPADLDALMIRGWVNTELLKDAKAGVADYTRVATASPESIHDFAWKALAQSKTGKKLDADATMQKALGVNPSAEDLYYAAVYYTQSGNLEKGLEFIEKAKANGFQNIYLLDKDNTADLNIAPLRKLTVTTR